MCLSQLFFLKKKTRPEGDWTLVLSNSIVEWLPRMGEIRILFPSLSREIWTHTFYVPGYPRIDNSHSLLLDVLHIVWGYWIVTREKESVIENNLMVRRSIWGGRSKFYLLLQLIFKQFRLNGISLIEVIERAVDLNILQLVVRAFFLEVQRWIKFLQIEEEFEHRFPCSRLVL